jgi:hypothetical protein
MREEEEEGVRERISVRRAVCAGGLVMRARRVMRRAWAEEFEPAMLEVV